MYRKYRNCPIQGSYAVSAAAVLSYCHLDAAFALAVQKALRVAGADMQVHDEIIFKGPDAEKRAKLFYKVLALEMDIAGFELWQDLGHLTARADAEAARAKVANLVTRK